MSDLARVVLGLVFGVITAGLVLWLGAFGGSRVDLLLTAASLAALLTAGLWLAGLALRRSRAWALAIVLGFWLPYVNLILVSVYARRYWAQDARLPGLLGIAGILGQTLVSLRALFLAPPTLI